MRKGDVDSIKKVQKRFTKLMKPMGHLTYPERLKALKLPTLTYHRARGDMIELYKMVTEKYDCT